MIIKGYRLCPFEGNVGEWFAAYQKKWQQRNMFSYSNTNESVLSDKNLFNHYFISIIKICLLIYYLAPIFNISILKCDKICLQLIPIRPLISTCLVINDHSIKGHTNLVHWLHISYQYQWIYWCDITWLVSILLYHWLLTSSIGHPGNLCIRIS